MSLKCIFISFKIQLLFSLLYALFLKNKCYFSLDENVFKDLMLLVAMLLVKIHSVTVQSIKYPISYKHVISQAVSGKIKSCKSSLFRKIDCQMRLTSHILASRFVKNDKVINHFLLMGSHEEILSIAVIKCENLIAHKHFISQTTLGKIMSEKSNLFNHIS